MLAHLTSGAHYQLGTTYSYSYTTTILLNEPPPLLDHQTNQTQGSDVGYQVYKFQFYKLVASSFFLDLVVVRQKELLLPREELGYHLVVVRTLFSHQI